MSYADIDVFSNIILSLIVRKKMHKIVPIAYILLNFYAVVCYCAQWSKQFWLTSFRI